MLDCFRVHTCAFSYKRRGVQAIRCSTLHFLVANPQLADALKHTNPFNPAFLPRVD